MQAMPPFKLSTDSKWSFVGDTLSLLPGQRVQISLAVAASLN